MNRSMKTTRDAEKLQALGYDSTPAELRRFQQEYNRLGPDRLIAVTGELDRATVAALALAYDSRALLEVLRTRGER